METVWNTEGLGSRSGTRRGRVRVPLRAAEGERAGGPPPGEEGASRVPAGAQEGGVGSARGWGEEGAGVPAGAYSRPG